jgi:hypothetical protein
VKESVQWPFMGVDFWPIGQVVSGRDTRHALFWFAALSRRAGLLDVLYEILYNDARTMMMYPWCNSGPGPICQWALFATGHTANFL